MVDLVQPVVWWRSLPLGTSITALASIALIECLGSSRYAHSLTARFQRSTRSPPSDASRRTRRDVAEASAKNQQEIFLSAVLSGDDRESVLPLSSFTRARVENLLIPLVYEMACGVYQLLAGVRSNARFRLPDEDTAYIYYLRQTKATVR